MNSTGLLHIFLFLSKSLLANVLLKGYLLIYFYKGSTLLFDLTMIFLIHSYFLKFKYESITEYIITVKIKRPIITHPIISFVSKQIIL